MTLCIWWIGTMTKEGYGCHGTPVGGTILAHREAWEEIYGPIPKGKEIHHLCNNRACCNVEHLRLVSRFEHTRIDGRNKNRRRCIIASGLPKGGE